MPWCKAASYLSCWCFIVLEFLTNDCKIDLFRMWCSGENNQLQGSIISLRHFRLQYTTLFSLLYYYCMPHCFFFILIYQLTATSCYMQVREIMDNLKRVLYLVSSQWYYRVSETFNSSNKTLPNWNHDPETSKTSKPRCHDDYFFIKIRTWGLNIFEGECWKKLNKQTRAALMMQQNMCWLNVFSILCIRKLRHVMGQRFGNQSDGKDWF